MNLLAPETVFFNLRLHCWGETLPALLYLFHASPCKVHIFLGRVPVSLVHMLGMNWFIPMKGVLIGLKMAPGLLEVWRGRRGL